MLKESKTVPVTRVQVMEGEWHEMKLENWAGTRSCRPKQGIRELAEMIQQESEIVVIILTAAL